MPKTTSFTLNSFNNVNESKTPIIYTGVADRYFYVNGKKTDKLEAVIVSGIAHGIGEIQLVLKPDETLKTAIEGRFNFAEPFYLKDLGVTTDAKVSIYEGNLIVKIFVDVEG